MVARFDLFPDEQVIGMFRGFREGGLEFHADLVLPYRTEFQSIPMHGQFLLVQLETSDEAVLGRITTLSSEGKLTTPSGEDFNIRAVSEHRQVPDDLREQYLRYRVNIRVLGVLRNTGDKLTFVASHRRLPHVGSPVAFPSGPVLQEIMGHNQTNGAPVGHFALGEYLYAENKHAIRLEEWMQFRSPEVLVKFPIESLVSRRSFVFARAGLGKSNLNKLLFSKLYEKTPTVEKRGGRQVPVGTVIFDPDGEYFWPDDKGRPGLADVPHLLNKLVVFTSRRAPSPYYQSFIAGGIKLDIRRLRPSDVIGIAIGPDRQEQQNVRKLAAMSQATWSDLVSLIHRKGYGADVKQVSRLLSLDEKQEAEALAARSNMSRIVHQLHDPSSQLMDLLITALAQGKLCVVDVSQMRGSQSLILSGLILRRIFDRNQEEFTKEVPKTIPTIAVIEEAQSVLNERSLSAEPYITWVKEGRKYDLGAVMITQQPGSIPTDILSQGDIWFIFHLLSAADLAGVQRANAHFSDDILSALLNEPIPGQGVIWSSAVQRPYPLSVRVLSFEQMYTVQDPSYRRAAAKTYASELMDSLQQRPRATLAPVSQNGLPGKRNGHVATAQGELSLPNGTDGAIAGDDSEWEDDKEEQSVDVLAEIENIAIAGLAGDESIMTKLQSQGAPWGMPGIMGVLLRFIPEQMDDRRQIAYNLVPKALNQLFGPREIGWLTERVDGTTVVRVLPQSTERERTPPDVGNSGDDLPF